jgi:hypothetical protein
MILFPFTAFLVQSLDKTGAALPLKEDDKARLIDLLPPGETTLLVLRDDVYTEEIEVENTCGDIIIKNRGLNGTTARKFPRGSAVCFEVTVSVVKYLICNYDCCLEGVPAPTPVSITAAYFPNGTVTVDWSGIVIFEGTDPLILAISDLPAWATATVGPNFIKVEGTPTYAEQVTLSVAGTNAAGIVTTQVESFTIAQ